MDPKQGNSPILAQITVRKAAGDVWVSWRKRLSPDTWDVSSAYTLYLKPFGEVPFVPGFPVPVARIDVQGDRKATGHMKPGSGATAPGWAQKWNRLVAEFGPMRADRWASCRFEFTPLTDTTVRLELMGTQSRAGALLAWTYYDDFRVQGAELVNGDFERVGSDGKIEGWNCVLDQNWKAVRNGKAGVVTLPNTAASGSRMARTSHDHRVTQSIKVKKDQKVTVSFQARGALPESL